MDYITTKAPPVPLKIDGKEYKVPRFLMTEIDAFIAAEREKAMEQALAEFKDEEKRATFRLYHRVPAVDILAVINELATPDGCKTVLRTCLAKAEVPATTIEDFILYVDPELQRSLVDQLRSGNGMLERFKDRSGEPKGPTPNPSTGQPPTSDGSPTTTDKTPPTSTEPTRAATPTA